MGARLQKDTLGHGDGFAVLGVYFEHPDLPQQVAHPRSSGSRRRSSGRGDGHPGALDVDWASSALGQRLVHLPDERPEPAGGAGRGR
jgi:hypothetical protein